VIRAYICGDGFLGTELSKDFNENSHYSVSSQFLELKRPQSLKSKQLEIISQEFHDQNNSIFINASGPSSVQESFSNYEVAVEQPSQQVLKHMEILSFTQEPILYVYISSASVYGETSNLGVTEDGALNPMSPYAEGKIKAEDTLKSLMQNINPLVSILILRVFSAYSENLTTRILNKIVVAAKQNQHIDLAGDGHESRDFTHSSDISRVIKFWEKKGEQRRQIFNVGSGEGMELRRLMEIADTAYVNVYKRPLDYSFDGSKRIGDPINLVANIEKLLNLGFKPAISPGEGLERYFRKNFSA
jgi:nucleoside-diphosphate-sugar epimerase